MENKKVLPQVSVSPHRVPGLGIALVNPLETRTQEFIDWFALDCSRATDGRIRGYRAGQLFRALKLRMPREPHYEYLAVYELDPMQPQNPIALLDGAPGIGQIGPLQPASSPAPSAGSSVALLYTAIMNRVDAPDNQDLPPAGDIELPPLSNRLEVSIVFSKPVDGLESEYNDWYSNSHVPEVVGRLKGYKSGQRFRLKATEPAQEAAYEYLAYYEAHAERSRASVGWLQKTERSAAAAAGRAPAISLTSALHDDRVTWIYGAISRRFEQD